MKLKHLLAVAPALALAAGAVSAQTPIRMGQTITGRLQDSDPKADDDSFYDLYSYTGRAGEQIVITLRSGDFDAYLAFAPESEGFGEFGRSETDDDGAGGTDACLEITLPADGTYLIRANSLRAGETGEYTLQVGGDTACTGEHDQEASPVDVSRARPIRGGSEVRGELSAEDPVMSDRSHYDLYAYTGRAGERVRVRMRSAAFDTYLAFGQVTDGDFRSSETDDDSGGGTDSCLEVSLPSDGTYYIRANSLSGGQTGAYTVQVGGDAACSPGGSAGKAADTSPVDVSRARRLRLGQQVSGELTTRSPVLGDRSRYDLYSYAGRRGERIRITLESEAFDSYLSFGTVSGRSFQQTESDDDGAGGTNSRIDVTLPENGTYYVRANTLRAHDYGPYTVRVEAAPPPAARRPVRAGETVTGELEDTDPQAEDDTYYDDYVYSGKAGERLTITLSSDAFDAYLSFGRMGSGSFSSMETDDDGAGGTDSRLTVTLPSDGEYVIRANSMGKGTGAYTLRIESGGPAVSTKL
ncbi:MAG TPA: PPC domain-containing protein [Longimicrobiaceae bacterium]|nr:PPC domain-containing protein [Longimicrobiaceae bacterium]